MRLYAHSAARRSRQLVGDLLAVGAILLCIVVGTLVHGAVAGLAAFGQSVADTGSTFSGAMEEIGETLSGVPLIGGGIRAPFDTAAEGAASLERLGLEQQDAVLRLAAAAGIATAILPVLLVLLLWLPPRLRFVRRARAVAMLGATSGGDDLLALRALASQPLHALRKVDADVAAAWRRGDAGTIATLADLERIDAGLPVARGA